MHVQYFFTPLLFLCSLYSLVISVSPLPSRLFSACLSSLLPSPPTHTGQEVIYLGINVTRNNNVLDTNTPEPRRTPVTLPSHQRIIREKKKEVISFYHSTLTFQWSRWSIIWNPVLTSIWSTASSPKNCSRALQFLLVAITTMAFLTMSLNPLPPF